MKKTLITILILGIIAGIGLKTYYGFQAASEFFQQKRENLFGLKFKVKEVELNWIGTSIALKNVTIYPAGKKVRHQLASAKRVVFDLSPFELLSKRFYISKIIFDKPKSSYVVYSRNRANWDVLDLSDLDENGSENQDNWQIQIDKIIIKDGSFKYRNRVDRNRLDLNRVQANIKKIVSEPNPKKMPSKVHLKAQVANTKGRININGRVNLLADGINFKLNSKLSKMRLTYFAPFYAGEVPFPIRSGTISGTSKASSVKSQFVAHNHMLLENIKAGGVKGKMLNAFFLRHGNRVRVNATAKGNLEKGDITISKTTTQAITNQLMSQAFRETPVGKAGRKIKKGGKKLKRKIKNIFR